MFGGQSSTPFGYGPPQNSAPAFGSSTGGGLFGSTTTTTTPTFGAPATSSFGGGGGFGAPAPAPSGGLFGSSTAGTSTFGGGFGAPPQQPSAFGAPAGGGGLFGSSTTATGFGTTPTFGAPAPSTGLFGSTSQPATSLFGAPQPQQSAFGGNTTGGFGSSMSTTTSSFGAPPAPGGGLFGSPAPAAQFGAPAPSAFGAPAAGGGLFGSPAPAQPSAFGSSTFGAGPPKFGSPPAPATGGLFGSTLSSPATAPAMGAGGTRAVPYTITSRADGSTSIMMQDITAMPQYEAKSAEELRFEDYSQGNKGTPAPGVGGFGAPSGGGLFGAPPAPAASFGGGGFGSPAPAPFGATSSFFGAPAPAGGLFGAAPAPAPGAFSFSPAPAPGGGLFGSTASTTPTFGGGPAAPAPFGSTTAPAPYGFGSAPAPSGGLFGSTTSNTAFGSSPAAGFFGSSTAPAPFGSPAPAPAGGLFGAPAASSPAPGGGFFGAPAPASTSFGGFGSTTTGSLFGSPAPAAPAPFGTTGGFGGFGSAPTAFGQPSPAPFSLGGAQQSAPSLYGMPQQQQSVQQQQPQSVFPQNVQIMPPGVHEVIDQQLRALEEQRKELEKAEVWRGSPAKVPATTPTNIPDPFGFHFSPPALASSMPYTVRSAVRIKPRGITSRSTTSVLASTSSTPTSRYSSNSNLLMSPEQQIRSSKLQLVLKPESVKPPSRLGRLNLDSPTLLSPPPVPTETVDEPPPEDGFLVDTGVLRESSATPRFEFNQETKSSPVARTPPEAASPGFNYYQKVIGSTEDASDVVPANGNVASRAVTVADTKLSFVPVLTKAGYKVSPSLEELSAMSEADLAAVYNFSVARPGYGKVEWDGSVDVRSANLDRIVSIECQDVSVYTQDEEAGTKPPMGTKLNRSAVITFYDVYPRNGGSQATDEEREKFAKRVKRSTQKMGAEFLSYDERTGIWKIRVQHFSRYSLLDVEEEEEDEEEEENSENKHEYGMHLQHSTVETRKATPLEPRHISLQRIDSSESGENDEDGANLIISDIGMSEYELCRKIERDAEIAFQEVYSMTKSHNTSLAKGRRAVIIKPFTYENEGFDVESVADGSACEDLVLDDTFATATTFSISEKLQSQVGLTKTEIDHSHRMGRSFRVGWLPNGSFITLQKGLGQSTFISQARPLLSDDSSTPTSISLLRSLKDHSIRLPKEGNEMCPLYSLPRVGADTFAEAKIARAIESFASICDTNNEASHGYKLLLYYLDDSEDAAAIVDGTTKDTYPTNARFLSDVYHLLVSICSADVKKDIDSAKSRGDMLSAVLYALSGGDVDTACNIACEAGYAQLAVALSTSTDGRKDIYRHLLELTTMNPAQKSRLNTTSWRILNGISNKTDGQSIFFGTSGSLSRDWRRHLLLLILQNRQNSLIDVLEQFDHDLKSGRVPFPLPRYRSSDEISSSVKCIFYHLLSLCSGRTSVLEAMNPLGYSPFAHDYALPFHFAAAISASCVQSGSVAALSHDAAESIIDGYVVQLINGGNWDWAVFVSLFTMTEPSLQIKLSKIDRAKAIVLRNYTESRSIASRMFLEQDVGIPTEWFEEALAYRCANAGNAYGYVDRSLAFDPAAGFLAFREIILPCLFFSARAEIDSIAETLKQKPSNDSLIEAMLCYFDLDKAIMELSEKSSYDIVSDDDLQHYFESCKYIEQTLIAFESQRKRTPEPDTSLLPVTSKVNIEAMISEARHHLRYLKAQIHALERR